MRSVCGWGREEKAHRTQVQALIAISSQCSPHLPTLAKMAVTLVPPRGRLGAFTMEAAPLAVPAYQALLATGISVLVSTVGRSQGLCVVSLGIHPR